MKKPKTYNLFAKIRGALRNIYRFSPMRREAINQVKFKTENMWAFKCQICKKLWPVQMAEVDHIPALGPLNDFDPCDGGLGQWGKNLFYGTTRVICKICHHTVTANQRRKNVRK